MFNKPLIRVRDRNCLARDLGRKKNQSKPNLPLAANLNADDHDSQRKKGNDRAAQHERSPAETVHEEDRDEGDGQTGETRAEGQPQGGGVRPVREVEEDESTVGTKRTGSRKNVGDLKSGCNSRIR